MNRDIKILRNEKLKNIGAKSKPKKRFRWFRFTIIVIVTVIATPYLTYKGIIFYFLHFQNIFGFQPKEMALAQYPIRDVVGDMGGVPVTMAMDFAEYVEYKGDPGFGEKRKGPYPKRTHQSELTSFGYKVRYPDMAILSTPSLRAERRAERFPDVHWLSGGVITRAGFAGEFDGFMKRMAAIDISGTSKYVFANYQKLPDKLYGLAVYELRGADLNGLPYKNYEDLSLNTQYVFFDTNNEPLTHISCPTNYKSSCTQTWSLEKMGIKIEMDVSYPPQFIQHWKDIQEKVTTKLLSYRIDFQYPSSPSSAQVNRP